MNNLNQSYIGLAIRLLLGTLFIFSGITKLFPIHLTELNLVYHHISNWNISPYLARILIISEIFIGIALLFGIYLKKITISLAILFTSIFSIYLLIILFKDGNAQNCGCFGSVLPLTPLESLGKNIIIVLMLLWLRKIASFTTHKHSIVFFTFSTITSVGLILFYFPIYTWLNVNPDIEKTVPFDFNAPIIFSNNMFVNLNKNKKLIGIFNMNCENCREVAYKIGILSKQNKIDNFFLLLVGEEEDIKGFMIETHLSYPYKRYTFFEFIRLYPNSTWPWLLLSDDGKIKKQWIYETFDVKNFVQQLN